MSIALMIMGLILGSGLSIFQSYQNHKKQEITGERMNVIARSLALYVMRHNCLPCAASSSEDGNLTEDVYHGYVPYRQLNLDPIMAKDGYNHPIRYGVNRHLTETSPAQRYCEQMFGDENFDIKDGNGRSLWANDPGDFPAVILISEGMAFGQNKGQDEKNNISGQRYTQKKFSQDPQNPFRHHVQWFSKDILMSVYGNNPCKHSETDINKSDFGDFFEFNGEDS